MLHDHVFQMERELHRRQGRLHHEAGEPQTLCCYDGRLEVERAKDHKEGDDGGQPADDSLGVDGDVDVWEIR